MRSGAQRANILCSMPGIYLFACSSLGTGHAGALPKKNISLLLTRQECYHYMDNYFSWNRLRETGQINILAEILKTEIKILSNILLRVPFRKFHRSWVTHDSSKVIFGDSRGHLIAHVAGCARTQTVPWWTYAEWRGEGGACAGKRTGILRGV